LVFQCATQNLPDCKSTRFVILKKLPFIFGEVDQHRTTTYYLIGIIEGNRLLFLVDSIDLE